MTHSRSPARSSSATCSRSRSAWASSTTSSSHASTSAWSLLPSARPARPSCEMHGVDVDVMPDHPKMGPLIVALMQPPAGTRCRRRPRAGHQRARVGRPHAARTRHPLRTSSSPATAWCRTASARRCASTTATGAASARRRRRGAATRVRPRAPDGLFRGAPPKRWPSGPPAGTRARIDLRVGARVTSIDRERREVTADDGADLAYDIVVLATGSAPFVPPVPGVDKKGVFVYRTIEDLDAIIAYGEAEARRGDRRRPARPGGREGGPRPRPGDARRRVCAPPDAAADRRSALRPRASSKIDAPSASRSTSTRTPRNSSATARWRAGVRRRRTCSTST